MVNRIVLVNRIDSIFCTSAVIAEDIHCIKIENCLFDRAFYCNFRTSHPNLRGLDLFYKIVVVTLNSYKVSQKFK